MRSWRVGAATLACAAWALALLCACAVPPQPSPGGDGNGRLSGAGGATPGVATDTTAIDTVAEDDPLGQAVLVLPFRDSSKYGGPWDIYTGLAQVLADSLATGDFIHAVRLGRVLPRLVGDEVKGKIDPGRAVSLGKGVGADWVILGEIEALTMKRFQATMPVGGYRRYEGWTTAMVTAYRVIDGQPAGEYRVESEVDNRRTGIANPAAHVPLDREYSLLDLIEWGSREFWGTLVGQAVAQCAGDLAHDLEETIRPPPELAVSEPKIIDVDGDRAYINVGLVEGIQNGDKYGVWDLGRELRDPETGTFLGRALPRRVAVVQVEQVLSDHLSQVRILEGRDQVEKSYSVRAE